MLRVEAAHSELINRTGVKITTPANLTAGTYNITCNMTGLIPSSAPAIGQLTLLDINTMDLVRVSPDVTMATTNDTLTLHGSGFVDTSELQCYYGDLKTPLETTFVDSSEVRCVLPKTLTTTPKESKVFLSFAAYKRAEYALSATHHVGLELPEIKSARFGDRLSRVVITFDGIIRTVNESVQLSDILPHNHTSFGTKASFKISADKLIIFMLGDPTITLGNLMVDKNQLKSRADRTIYPNVGMVAVTLQKPTTMILPKVVLMGATTLGKHSLVLFLICYQKYPLILPSINQSKGSKIRK